MLFAPFGVEPPCPGKSIDKTLLKIKELNDDLNRDLPAEEISRNVFWKIKKFEWSNMFSYGEDNIVDFTKLNGIFGMFAPNASGKSALLDSLSFCLFDTSARAFKELPEPAAELAI